jgi:peptide/nickel transport system ATP-binding protein
LTIPGSVPPPSAFGGGCRFAGRCPFVVERCRAEEPPLAALAPGHRAACWRAPLERHLGEVAG